ncbi:bile acid:sodium symporter family protein [Anabaena sp. FACHB-1237]|uniref:bile acid:sodium symporter family protein n=1 Tax=Anabaena sp. FACHB-1237 TaxID=2692769 RepID=UPI0016806DDB|nr:bile acid:sodium symporter family protein [Anabaena sp. FACHB-1237]MBD2138212.1 bile acid:sodium symporter family protein [Anabaena sp. FACHB-1237]
MQANFLTTFVLPTALGIIMLGMGLSLELKDFKRVTEFPKSIAVGLFSQLFILPIIGFLIAKTIPMQPEIALGLVIVAICPGGPSSNLITFLAKGDVALSVTLTAFSSIITVVTIPLLGNLAYEHFIGETAQIALPIGKTILQIFLMTLLPISVGMSIKQMFPQVANSLEKTTNIFAALFLAIIIILLVIREWNRLPEFIFQAGLGVIMLNTISMLAAFNISKLFNLNLHQKICIAIEVGIQNGTLAIAITAGLLNNQNMAIPAALYSLFMNITGFIAIIYGRNLTAINEV